MPIIGIDFGTTNSVLSFFEDGAPSIIPNKRGGRLTPSVVSIDKNHNILVGLSAKNQILMNPTGTITEVKRKLGIGHTYNVFGKEYTSTKICYYIFDSLKKEAEEFFGEEVTQAVVTVPAHFLERQRQEIIESAKQAGLEVLRIINEPTAAALSYAYLLKDESFILVYDLGGGTFDVTVLHKHGNGFTVLSSIGDSNIGGKDFDEILFAKALEHFEKKYSIKIEDLSIRKQLLESVENAKKELSESKNSIISLPFVNKNGSPVHLNYEITREEFEKLISEKINKTIEIMDRAIKDSGISEASISGIIFSGGSSRIPMIHNIIEKKYSFKRIYKINPDEVVSLGASVMISILDKSDSKLTLKDVSYFTLGIESENDTFIPIINRNTPIPTEKKKYFTTVIDGQDNVEIHILQGESEKASNNVSLGRFLLSGIKPAKMGKPKIEVLFSVDENGLSKVKAKDVESGNQNEIDIIPSSLENEEEYTFVKIESILKQLEYMKGQYGFSDGLMKEYNELCEFYVSVKKRSKKDEVKDVYEALDVFYREVKGVIFDS